MGLPTLIMANMTSEQLEAYTLHLRIEEISQKLKIDDVVPADGDRYDYFSLSFFSFSIRPSFEKIANEAFSCQIPLPSSPVR